MDRKWLTIKLSPKEYARMIGHTEKFVRTWCMPEPLKQDSNARIEMRIDLRDILENCNKLTIVGSEERGIL